jgi:CheY-like chemotaxis protein
MNDYQFPEHLDWSDKTILIYEQDESSAILLKEILECTNINIAHVTDKAGMKKVIRPVNVIIQGIGVNEMVGGLPFTRETRLQFPGIPMIAHTACCSDKKNIQKCFDTGCEAFLGKPFDFEDLADLLIFYLGE